jgi:Mrp family chromosome partitioning ATPase
MKITITVAGLAGVGKSAISQQIAGQLQAIGFPVTVNFLDGPPDGRSTTKHMRALRAIQEKGIEIEINEKQAVRSSLDEEI